MLYLNELPIEHKLRNTPLGELDAKYRWKKSSENAQRRTVKVGATKLVNFTFNQLGSAWTESDW